MTSDHSRGAGPAAAQLPPIRQPSNGGYEGPTIERHTPRELQAAGNPSSVMIRQQVDETGERGVGCHRCLRVHELLMRRSCPLPPLEPEG